VSPANAITVIYSPVIVSAYRYIAITNLPITAVFVEYLRQFLIDLNEIYRHSPAVREITLQLSPYKVFLVFLYLCVVLNKNLKDDTLSSLSNLHNMQIKSAITKKIRFRAVAH